MKNYTCLTADIKAAERESSQESSESNSSNECGQQERSKGEAKPSPPTVHAGMPVSMQELMQHHQHYQQQDNMDNEDNVTDFDFNDIFKIDKIPGLLVSNVV